MRGERHLKACGSVRGFRLTRSAALDIGCNDRSELNSLQASSHSPGYRFFASRLGTSQNAASDRLHVVVDNDVIGHNIVNALDQHRVCSAAVAGVRSTAEPGLHRQH